MTAPEAAVPPPLSDSSSPPAPATLAQASRRRRDLAGGEVMDEDRLIRFVPSPEGAVVPDLARKLPGRGLWVEARRAAVETAARKGLFSRAAKRKLSAPADLADLVEALLMRRLLAGLGLARKAGDLVTGFEKVRAGLVSGKAAFLVEAVDGAADGRRKLLGAAFGSGSRARLIGLFTGEELSLALGGENVIHTLFLAGRGAQRWAIDVDRLCALLADRGR